MPITKNSLVTLDYRLSSPEGETLHEEKELMYVHGGYDQIFAKVEAALKGKEVGDTIRVTLSPDEAFGEYDGSLVIEEALSELPEELEVGMEIDGYSEEYPDDVMIYTVKEIRGDKQPPPGGAEYRLRSGGDGGTGAQRSRAQGDPGTPPSA